MRRRILRVLKQHLTVTGKTPVKNLLQISAILFYVSQFHITLPPTVCCQLQQEHSNLLGLQQWHEEIKNLYQVAKTDLTSGVP